MALGLAVGDLFDALPKSYRSTSPSCRRSLGDLEAHAAASRLQVEQLESLDAVDEEHCRRSWGARGGRSTEAVAALESIRLDLLRLHGGETDLRPITSVLEASQQIGVELARLTTARARSREHRAGEVDSNAGLIARQRSARLYWRELTLLIERESVRVPIGVSAVTSPTRRYGTIP